MGVGSSNEWLESFLDAHRDELVAFRRHLHAFPELSGRELQTTELVAERLRAAGLAPKELAGGVGLCCDIGDVSPDSPGIALRADLDALAMDDLKTVSYRSRVAGCAHACGHDVHTSIVLGAGLALAARGLRSGRGGVRLLFEPAEEAVPGGAVDLIEQGALDNIGAVFGFHCDPKIDVGRVGLRVGALTAATDAVTIHLRGPGGHTARPQLTVDLVAVASRVAVELPGRVADAAQRAGGEIRLVFGAIHAGDAPNVIPVHAELRGSVRVPDRGLWDRAESLVTGLVADLVAGTGAEIEIEYRRGIPPVVNDAAAVAAFEAVAVSVLGPAGVVDTPRSYGGDSFAWYLERVPGCYVRLGVHDPAWGTERHDLHSGSFDVAEDAIEIGVRLLVELVARGPQLHSPHPT
ncbi:MAG TPA: amidohydrolase [Microthrixaceae bacterium]|nr:amidohydrolase [Microthrixaceae bacterium]HMT25005.1 amidohydrolase [Microthrixaceae bacterium]HMT61032.1 amidohydrolase [Microthrixaceae bacterium]